MPQLQSNILKFLQKGLDNKIEIKGSKLKVNNNNLWNIITIEIIYLYKKLSIIYHGHSLYYYFILYFTY